MIPKSTVSLVAMRRFLVRRPWVFWLATALVAIAIAASALQRAERVDAERAAWGETVAVAVAASDLAPGEPLVIEYIDMPAAVAPVDVADRFGGVARQHIAAGEPVMQVDVVSASGSRALIPDGWLATPIGQSSSVGASIGDAVVVAADGFVIAEHAVVVGVTDDITLVATPRDVAPHVAAATLDHSATLLLAP